MWLQAIENSILPEEQAMYSSAVKLSNNTKPGVYGNASDLRGFLATNYVLHEEIMPFFMKINDFL